MMISLNGREVSVKSMEIENLQVFDYPDFCDAFLAYAEFVDGTELTEVELCEVENKFPCEINQLAHESIF